MTTSKLNGSENKLIMKALVIGKNGQLGWELLRTSPAEIEVVAYNSADLDISNTQQVNDMVTANRPDWIINAAAYTAVDKAESETEKAFAVNRDGIVNLGGAAKEVGAGIIHISTDFVFDGLKSSPYLTDDLPNPTGIYGKSKLAGERCLLGISGDKCAIIRTAWVYSCHGTNFVKTMLRLMRERDELGVVADQIGTPTWARGLAQAVWQVLVGGLFGVYHWTDAGAASWYDFAVAIMEEALALGLLSKAVSIKPIRTIDYPTPAHRPAYSVLDKTALWQHRDLVPVHWRVALRSMLTELAI